jgi:peptidyl-prolyl isomerase E (cyclophilin E)
MSHKKILYVGGLDEKVDQAILHAAFIPFGDIREVQIPLDNATQKNRGFGFVDFEEQEDAAAALDNMNNAELYGKVLKVNIAKPVKNKLGSHKAVWAEAEDWYNKTLTEDGGEGGAAPAVPSLDPGSRAAAAEKKE